ncbi:iron-sulfur cluster assembly 2-like protein [Zopfochytrium polystomum]|nr:iron-sulfur cluster assembly 2-like protein [Zopfochytrium polystomum]
MAPVRFASNPAAAAAALKPAATDAAAAATAGAVSRGSITIGDSAAKRIRELNSKCNVAQAFRVSVEAGGCHGYQYVMGLTSEPPADEDIVFEKDGARVYIDQVSLDLVSGSSLEFVEELIGSSFQIVGNPNAESSCGCKTSFNIS